MYIDACMRHKTRKVLRLRQLRRAREMSQRTLAQHVGLKPSSICLIERGQRQPSLDKARDIAKLFDLSVEEVFSYVEVPA